MLINAILHEPRVGYDASDHLRYIGVLGKLHLPLPVETKEYFVPPLPYLIPSLVTLCNPNALMVAAKFAQVINVLLSCGLCLFLLKICQLIKPDDRVFKIASLATLACIPVYYKTFALVRGEPYVAFFGVFVTYLTLRIFIEGSGSKYLPIGLGAAMGGLLLSRQWGALLIIGTVCFVLVACKNLSTDPVKMLKKLFCALAVAFIAGGWFYLHLWKDNGSLTSFPRDSNTQFALTNNPSSFYLGLGDGKLFTDPVRNGFNDQFLPIMYSETWGDYWCYFVICSEDLRDHRLMSGRELADCLAAASSPPEWLKTNRFEVGSYLGRVNIVSLIPTAVILAGFIMALVSSLRFMFRRQTSNANAAWTLLLSLVLATLAGYAWFLIRYPHDKIGDTIKPTYILQIFPLLAIMAGNFLRWLHDRSKVAFKVVVLLLVLSFLHNCPTMITHCLLRVFR